MMIEGLFEILCLEAAAAGLNRKMIENKKENYRKALDNFNPGKVSKYDHEDFDRLMGDRGIIRNKAKIGAFISNAQAILRVQEEFGSFDKFIWSYVNDKPMDFSDKTRSIPLDMSKDLKKRGFKFLGPSTTTMFMFHAGMLRWIGEHCPWK